DQSSCARVKLSGCLPRCAGANRKLSSVHQVEIIAALDENRAGANSYTNSSANCRTCPTSRDSADQCTDSTADGCTCHGALSLTIAVSHTAFVVYADIFAAGCSPSLNKPCEAVTVAATQTDALEFERHRRAP